MTFIRRLRVASIAATLLGCVSLAFAGSDLQVSDAWVRATLPGQPVAAAYLTLQSPSRARLVAAQSGVARAVEIHEMSQKDGVMRMRRVEALELPQNQKVRMAPGGVHFMLLDLQRPLVAGEEIELDLVTVADGEGPTTTRVHLPVKKEPAR